MQIGRISEKGDLPGHQFGFLSTVASDKEDGEQDEPDGHELSVISIIYLRIEQSYK
jgi:hypothetical protein